MSPLERSAAIAVVVMTAPAFLAFPALGLWYVTTVWPAMTLYDRGLFLLAVIVFVLSIPYLFHHGFERARQGRFADLLPSEIALIAAPILMGGWVLTHRLDAMLFVAAQGGWKIYRAYRKQQKNPPSQLKSF